VYISFLFTTYISLGDQHCCISSFISQSATIHQLIHLRLSHQTDLLLLQPSAINSCNISDMSWHPYFLSCLCQIYIYILCLFTRHIIFISVIKYRYKLIFTMSIMIIHCILYSWDWIIESWFCTSVFLLKQRLHISLKVQILKGESTIHNWESMIWITRLVCWSPDLYTLLLFKRASSD
jgi:hypothetical protein